MLQVLQDKEVLLCMVVYVMLKRVSLMKLVLKIHLIVFSSLHMRFLVLLVEKRYFKV